MATLEDVARLSGVAKATASRALRNDSSLKLSADTKDKIFKAAEELGYEVKSKKSLERRKSVLVIHKDDHFQNQIDNAFYFSMRTGIENACLLYSYTCNFVPYGMIDTMESECDGAIVMGNFEKEQLAHILKKSHTTKVVFAGLMNFFPEQMDWITYDVCLAEKLLLDYLYAKGKRKIAYMGGKETPGILERYSKIHNFCQLLKNYDGMECIGELTGNYGAQSGYSMMHEWIAKGKTLPDAIVTSNDPIAFGVLKAMAEDSDIPRTSIISINGDSSGEITNPSLTSIDVHTQIMGEQAIHLLRNQFDTNRSYCIKIEISPEIIERNSVY